MVSEEIKAPVWIKMNEDYEIYTDGGYSIPEGVGGAAFVILKNGKMVAEGKYKVLRETSQRAELKAIILAIWKVPEGSSVKIYTDSQYAISVLGRIPKKPKKNLELIGKFWEIKANRRLRVVFEWVKGHNGDMWNEYCDKLCGEAAVQDKQFDYRELQTWDK